MSHWDYVLFSYAAALIVLVGTTASVWLRHRALKREIAAFATRGPSAR